ncbi:MAG: beta-ketoacyl-[acyl-carrier-protein] synthase family protein, partial [Burkholderiales bacterium]|nr:beta-ketoacyl-[acyl-carrier-protein] synthase family protein [Burkholderiales bacterium]
TFDANCRALYADHRRMRPTSVVTGMPNAPLAELALRWGARAAALGYACACASAAVAIGEGMRAVREGRVDVAIVGGSEALISPGVVLAWQAMRVLAPVAAGGGGAEAACRPFAADRNGFALGEGAAALVLESAAHARARGARWHSRLAGYATNCDARHITQPDPEGQQRAMAEALRDAGLVAADIGHVNAHGTATQAGDAAEAASLRRLFGPLQAGAAAPAVSGTKAVVGHLLGAGGALELVATLRALERRLAPPTGAVARVDPAFEIDLVRGSARELPALRHAMSNSFAFGGTNAVLIASAVD